MNAAKELLTKSDIAELLSIDPRSVERWAKSGRIPRPLKLGRLARWRRDDVMRAVGDGWPIAQNAAAQA